MNKLKTTLIFSIALLSAGFLFFIPTLVLASDINNPFPMPGRTQGTGTFFEITDSRYLNVTLGSDKEINLILESIPKIISLDIAALEDSIDSVNLSLSGLEPNKTYYKYQDSHKNEDVFVADNTGKFSWTQDLSITHHIWIQEQKSTTYIDQDTTLDADITGSVEITNSGVTLDCNGHNIIGSGSGYGIYIYDKINTTVKNCNVSNFYYGIYLGENNSFYNTISNNNIFTNENGLLVQSSSSTPQSSNNYILNNRIYSNVWVGLEFYGNSNNNIIGNSISDNGTGFLLNWAPSNYLRNNTITNNGYNFGVYGGQTGAEQDIDTSNTINGKPIYYWVNVNSLTIDASLNPGYIGIVNSENITIKDVTITNNVQGIYLENTTHSRIENTHLINNIRGIEMNYGSENEIVGNEVSESMVDGIRLGISSRNLVTDNTIFNNETGIRVAGSWSEYSYDNKIYHNNFKNNQTHIINSRAYGSLFDNGYPSGGNYYSDYTGIDEKSGENQDQPGADGIGDTPQFLFGGQDNYPFMNEDGWGEKEVPLYTQIRSPYPSDGETQIWAALPYADGRGAIDPDGYGPEKPCGLTIAECGCAITSMVMLGRYYNLDVGTDNSDVDPGNINAWLTDHEGYNSYGRLFWDKAIEYLGFVEQPSGKKMAWLDFNYKTDWNVSPTNFRINDFVNSKKPIVVYSRKYGHYFIIDGKNTQDIYTVKDPVWYNTKSLSDTEDLANHIRGYNNYFNSANLFTYLKVPKKIIGSIHIAVASPVELLIIDPMARKIGKDPTTNNSYDEVPNAKYSEEGSIISSDNPLDESEIHKTKEIHIQTPIDGIYNIQVIGTGIGGYTIDCLIYDNQGNSHTQTLTGNIKPNLTHIYNLDFTPDNPENISIKQIDTTPPEAKIYFDKDNKTLKVEGIDDVTQNPKVTIITQDCGFSNDELKQTESEIKAEIKDNGLGVLILAFNRLNWEKKKVIYQIKDEAGNTLILTFRRIIDKKFFVYARLESLQYNNNPIIVLPKTIFSYFWFPDKNPLFIFQGITVQNQFFVGALYNSFKNQTTTVTIKQNQREKQTLSGLVIIKLVTNLGNLEFEF